NEVERIQLGFGNCLVKLFQGDAFTSTGQCGVACDCLAALSNLPGGAFVVGYQEDVACTRHAGEAKDLYRTSRKCLANVFTIFVKHRTDTTVCASDHYRVSYSERTGLHKHGRNRPPATIKVCLNRHTACVTIWVCVEFKGRVCGQQD